jgi:hypothetical protein
MWVALAVVVVASSSIACLTATARITMPPLHTTCADGLPIRIIQDPACGPDAVCGYTCAPNRWKGPPC